MTDFRQVLLTDRLAWEFFGLAAGERLLYRRDPGTDPPPARQGSSAQKSLALLVLFDQVVLHDFGADEFRVPELESEGIVKVIAKSRPSDPVRPLKTNWRRGPLAKRSRPPASLLRSLRRISEERPFVVERWLASSPTSFESYLAKALKVSRRRYVNALLDYGIACATGDVAALDDNLLHRLPKELRKDITESLFDFERGGDRLDPINAFFVLAMVFADEIGIVQELSRSLGIGVATEHYRDRFAAARHAPPVALSSVGAAEHFLVVRAALAEERGLIPKVRDLRHALALRKDTNLRSLREMLVQFHSTLQAGDLDSLALARRELTAARRAMSRRHSWQRASDWITYLSLPVGIVETVLAGLPIASLSLAVIGAAGTSVASRVSKKNSWVFFSL